MRREKKRLGLRQIVGKVVIEEILNKIFSEFCIWK
jgi:tRNA U34 5-carboxymethylaminomethyl modifying GTPase MnmE/TrmE